MSVRWVYWLLLVTGCGSSPQPVAPCPCSCPPPAPPAVAEAPAPSGSADAPAPAPKTEPVPAYDAWLEYFERGSGKQQIFPIQNGKVVRVGRAAPNQANPDIDLGPLPDGNTVSRRHAEIVQRDGTWMLFIQPDTTNRSYLNTEIVDRGSLNPLKAGDEIQLGEITLVFRTR
jgi:pSer/pThr/pTyr-binding forkhead associated (FHA) protein